MQSAEWLKSDEFGGFSTVQAAPIIQLPGTTNMMAQEPILRISQFLHSTQLNRTAIFPTPTTVILLPKL